MTATSQLNAKSSEADEEEANREDEESEEKERMKKEARQSALSTQTYFDAKERNKETFSVMIDLFKEVNPQSRGVVEFIYTALKHMEDYNVDYDIDTYKKLIKLMPEGKYVPENIYQEEFYHYPKQQDCILTLLDNMEMKGICPDEDMAQILINRFGKGSQPIKKVWRQLYWFPKFKNANPWPVPFPPIKDRFLLTKLAIERIVSVDPQSQVCVWQSKSVPDAIDDTYIVSGQSPTQQRLLSEHTTTKSLFVEGPFNIWVGKGNVNYFMLRADPKELSEELEDPDDVSHIDNPFLYKKSRAVVPKPSVHEQNDGIILGVCATGSSSRDSLLSWIRLLEKNGNPALEHIPVIFSLKAPVQDITTKDGERPFKDEFEKVADQ